MYTRVCDVALYISAPNIGVDEWLRSPCLDATGYAAPVKVIEFVQRNPSDLPIIIPLTPHPYLAHRNAFLVIALPLLDRALDT